MYPSNRGSIPLIGTSKLWEEKFGPDFRGINGKKGAENNWKKNKHDILKRLSDNRASFEGKTHTDESKQKIGKANSIHQKGENNSNFGNMWICNIETLENKLVKKTDIIPDGWIKGRKIKQ